MTLHDKIMALPKRSPGQKDVVQKAAQIAKEADELIDWCQAHFDVLRALADSAGSFDEANIAVNKIIKFKEKSNES